MFFYVGNKRLFVVDSSDEDRLTSVIINNVFNKYFPDFVDQHDISMQDMQIILLHFKSHTDEVIQALFHVIKKIQYKDVGNTYRGFSTEFYNTFIS